MPNSTRLKTLTLSDGTYNNTLPLEDTTARNSIASLAASLAPVATSGSYNDLADVPDIPEALLVEFTENNGTWTCDTPIYEICQAIEDKRFVVGKMIAFGYALLTPVMYHYVPNDSAFVVFLLSSAGSSIALQGGADYNQSWTDAWNYSEFNAVDLDTYTQEMATKQDELISGINIRTINNQSLLGSGNITIQGSGGGGDTNVIEVVKVNGSALTPDANKAVNINNIPWSIVSSKPTIPDVSGKADKVSGGVTGHIAELDANGNLADGGVAASDVEDAVSKKHTHSNKTYLDKIPSDVGSNGQVLTSNGTSWSWQTPSSGGLTNYDYTHTIASGVSGTVAVTFPANKRCSVMYGATADIALAITCNNGADNYIWVKNNGSAAIDITISSVTFNNTSLPASKIFLPADGISVDKGCVCEIGVLCNADGVFITARGDLKSSS